MGDAGRRRRALRATQGVAGELGLPLIPVTTNLRPFHDGYAGWVTGTGRRWQRLATRSAGSWARCASRPPTRGSGRRLGIAPCPRGPAGVRVDRDPSRRQRRAPHRRTGGHGRPPPPRAGVGQRCRCRQPGRRRVVVGRERQAREVDHAIRGEGKSSSSSTTVRSASVISSTRRSSNGVQDDDLVRGRRGPAQLGKVAGQGAAVTSVALGLRLGVVARRPPTATKAASARRWALATHCGAAVERSSSRCAVGRITPTIVVSSRIIDSEPVVAAKSHYVLTPIPAVPRPASGAGY